MKTQKERREEKKLLLQIMVMYIRLMEKVIGDMSEIAFKHGYLPNHEDVELGNILRAKIKLLK